MTADLPWAPARGQTALRVIERSEAFVLCEDKGNFGFRFLYTRDGKCVSTGGQTLTLKARVMKPEPQPDPEFQLEPAPARHAPAAQKPAQMSLF